MNWNADCMQTLTSVSNITKACEGKWAQTLRATLQHLVQSLPTVQETAVATYNNSILQMPRSGDLQFLAMYSTFDTVKLA